MSIEVRYARSFLQDLKNLESSAYQQVCDIVFVKFIKLKQIQDLPGLHQIGNGAIFYRFSVDDYLIGIEVTGQIVKFLRVLPKPYIWHLVNLDRSNQKYESNLWTRLHSGNATKTGYTITKG